VPAGDALQDLQELKGKIAAARAAMQEYAHFPQHKVDAIFKAAAAAASASRIQLAVMAVEETGMGCMEDKVRRHGAGSHLDAACQLHHQQLHRRSCVRQACPTTLLGDS
jgi:acyl-CoA reductase-like NAD-dependent aldehyde dehydrogenase